MTINEFMKIIQESEMPTAILDFAEVKKYIPSMEKIRIAKEVMDFSVEYDRGFIKIDSYKKHLSFVFCAIESHTNLRFADSWSDKMQEYDMLCENELLDAIVDTFRKDYEDSLAVLNMMCDDIILDNSIEASVARLVQSIAENLDVIVGELADKIEDFNIEQIIPKNLDLNKLTGLLNSLK